jgi:rhodanese-related sulfurtransferase
MTPEAASILTPSPLSEITRDELLRRLNDPSLTIVDALPQASYETSHIPRSINVPVSEIEERAPVLLPDRAAEIAVYCAKFT